MCTVAWSTGAFIRVLYVNLLSMSIAADIQQYYNLLLLLSLLKHFHIKLVVMCFRYASKMNRIECALDVHTSIMFTWHNR